MRNVHALVFACLTLLCVTAARAQNPLVIEVQYPLAPGELFNFVFVSDVGAVTRESLGDPDGDGFIRTIIPQRTQGLFFSTPEQHMAGAKLQDFNILAGTGWPDPLIEDPITGLSLLPELNVIEPMVPLPVGHVLQVVNGTSSDLPGAIIRAPGIPFHDITDQQWANTEVFPLFTGTARVAEVVPIAVVPEPVVLLPLAMLMLLPARRRAHPYARVIAAP